MAGGIIVLRCARAPTRAASVSLNSLPQIRVPVDVDPAGWRSRDPTDWRSATASRRRPCASCAVSRPLSAACASPKRAPASRGTISRRRIASSSRTSASRLCAGGWSRAVPVQHGGSEGRWCQRIGNLVAIFGIGAGEFPAPALAHGLGEIALEIAEERKRRLRAPFLAHEQHRDRRRQQRDRQRGFDRLLRSAWLSSRSPSARLPIWSWFCRKLTKAVGASWPLGSPRVVRRDARTPRPDRQSRSPARGRCHRAASAR